MTETVTNPFASTTTVPPVVVGVDVGLPHERDADVVATRVGRRLDAAGIEALVCTHVVTGSQDRPARAALSVTLGSVPASYDVAWRWVLEALPPLRRDARALVAGDRSAGPAHLVDGARAAVAQRWSLREGRAVWFPGVEEVVGTLSVARLLETTPVECVRALGGGEPDGDALLRTRDFVRPRWEDGRLVLHVQPAAGGLLVPFEVPDPTPCCAFH